MPPAGPDVARGLDSLRRLVAEVLLAERPALAGGPDLAWHFGVLQAEATTSRANDDLHSGVTGGSGGGGYDDADLAARALAEDAEDSEDEDAEDGDSEDGDEDGDTAQTAASATPY